MTSTRVIVVLVLLLSLLMGGCSSTRESQSISETLSVEIIQSHLEASINQDVSVQLRTAPGALCFIAIEYASGFSKAKDVGPKHANAEGLVEWSWQVSSGTTTGTWPVTIVCSLGTDSVVTQLELIVLDKASEANGET